MSVQSYKMTGDTSLVFRIDDKLLQSRPPRLTLAATLAALSKRIRSGELDSNLVVEILNENSLLPYMIRRTGSVYDNSLGRNTNASKVGDIIVSEECIRGTYELCLAFLEFVLTVIKDPDYNDTTKTMLASLSYVMNEIYPSHHIWSYKRIKDMDNILQLCTETFHYIIETIHKDPSSKLNESQAKMFKETDDGSKKFTDLQLVCILSLSQHQAHKQLLDVIIAGQATINKKINELKLDTDSALSDNADVVSVRQSLMIFKKLLEHSKVIESHCDAKVMPNKSKSEASPSQYQHGASSSSAPMTNIEKALFDTSIRPGLLQHLFSYMYQKKDVATACIAVDLIKNIAKKFSMSLMACLGSEADRVCEFFVECLSNKGSKANLEVAILDLLSTCVKHQPGIIELFINYRKDNRKSDDKKDSSSSSPVQQSTSLSVIMDLLKTCKSSQDDVHLSLHSYIMKFILTFWQKQHSAIEHLDKTEDFWKLVLHPLTSFLDQYNAGDSGANLRTSTTTIHDDINQRELLGDKLTSYALKILAREIFCLNDGLAGRKMNGQLSELMKDLSAKNFVGKYSATLKRKYSKISEYENRTNRYNRLLISWRDFVASYARYRPFEIDRGVQNQVISNLLTCMAEELKLAEDLDKRRIAALGETSLLVWNKWVSAYSPTDPQSTTSKEIFDLVHELLYLADSSKEYLPYAFLLTFQSTLNIYLVRQREYIATTSSRSFDLIVPALQLMRFGLQIMEKNISEQDAAMVDQSAPERSYKSGVEARLCLASIMTLRFCIDVSRSNVPMWISYLRSQLKTDYLIHFMIVLMNKRTGSDLCIAMIEVLICLSSIADTAEYLNKSAWVSQVNMMAVAAYELPPEPQPTNNYTLNSLINKRRLDQISARAALDTKDNNQKDKSRGPDDYYYFATKDDLFDVSEQLPPEQKEKHKNERQQSDVVAMDGVSDIKSMFSPDQMGNSDDAKHHTSKLGMNINNDEQKWLPIYWHVIRLNISMILTLGSNYMTSAIEFLSIHCDRISDILELLRTKPRAVNMIEALQSIHLINLVLRHKSMWQRRSSQCYDSISDAIAKTAYTLSISALPPPVSSSESNGNQNSASSSASGSHSSLKPRDCLIYARCCYDFGKYTEAERVLFQTKFGDKEGFIQEAPQIYHEDLKGFAFHLAACICLKTSRPTDALEFALEVFKDEPKHQERMRALAQQK